jgi:hypothetical protein
MKSILPTKVAVISEWVPTEKFDTDSVHSPSWYVPVPRTVFPSENVTVPVGVPTPGDTAVTVAVNVTDWPYTLGFGVDVTLVWLDA